MKRIFIFVLALGLSFISFAQNGIKTPSVEILNITQTNATSYEFDVQVNTGCTRYVYLVADPNLLDMATAFGMTDVQLLEYFVSMGIAWVPAQDGQLDHYTVGDLEPNEQYAIYLLAKGVTDDDNLVLVEEFSTSETGGTGLAELTMTLTDLTETSATVNIEINDQTAYYWHAILSQDELTMLAEMGNIYLVSTITDEEVYNVMSALLDAGALYYKHSAPLTETYVNDPEGLVDIETGIEYIVCGFPFNANDELGSFTSPIHFIPGTGIISGGENGSSLSEVSMLQMEVYPNPAKDFVTLSADSKISSVEIFNTLGQKVFSLENGLTNMITINTTSFDRGVFVAKVKTEKGVTSTKLVIE